MWSQVPEEILWLRFFFLLRGALRLLRHFGSNGNPALVRCLTAQGFCHPLELHRLLRWAQRHLQRCWPGLPPSASEGGQEGGELTWQFILCSSKACGQVVLNYWWRLHLVCFFFLATPLMPPAELVQLYPQSSWPSTTTKWKSCVYVQEAPCNWRQLKMWCILTRTWLCHPCIQDFEEDGRAVRRRISEEKALVPLGRISLSSASRTLHSAGHRCPGDDRTTLGTKRKPWPLEPLEFLHAFVLPNIRLAVCVEVENTMLTRSLCDRVAGRSINKPHPYDGRDH
mmetsp:Transcript_20137/g.35745  ORF Transcript_20137/g.35745 Transcript_20137/m.35745 type:complete len:283 (-) Transcript_20137:285-1133(-)